MGEQCCQTRFKLTWQLTTLGRGVNRHTALGILQGAQSSPKRIVTCTPLSCSGMQNLSDLCHGHEVWNLFAIGFSAGSANINIPKIASSWITSRNALASSLRQYARWQTPSNCTIKGQIFVILWCRQDWEAQSHATPESANVRINSAAVLIALATIKFRPLAWIVHGINVMTPSATPKRRSTDSRLSPTEKS